jgi:predicted membrane-bound mannosyltransferase
MLATKELAPLFLIAALLGAIGARAKPLSQSIARDAGLALAAALVIALLFYASFGTNLGGVRAAIEALGVGVTRATGVSGHEKPWWYYLRLFEWERRGGIVWEQLGFTTLALAGIGVALLSGRKFLRWTAVYLAVLVLVMSLVPYKTPWHAIHFVPPLALLAAGALAAIPNGALAAFLALAVIAMQGWQTHQAVTVYPADERNPYAYVHSSPDVLKFRALVTTALERTPDQPVRIVSEEYWPLPWYLRGLPRVGYWSTPPDDCDGALVISSATQAGAVRSRLHGNYRESFLGLRPGFLCVVFIRNPPSP